MPSVEVVVPLSGTDPDRLRAWNFLRHRYGWPVIQTEGPDPWVKGVAVQAGLEQATAEVVVVADADCWTDGLGEAIAAVERGAGWAIPHRSIHRLTRESTTAYLAGADPSTLELDQQPYIGTAGGGYVVARREVMLSTPPDCRFVGWG